MPEPPAFDNASSYAAPPEPYAGDVYDAPAPKRRNPLVIIAAVLVGLCVCGFVGIFAITLILGGSIASLSLLSTPTPTATLTPTPTNTPLPPTPTQPLPPTDQPPPPVDETPEAAPTEGGGAEGSSDNPFFDDFSTDRGWPLVGPEDDPDYTVAWQGQDYSIRAKTPSIRAWVFPPVNYTPTNIEFDAIIPSDYTGQNSGTFGATCFYIDNENFHQVELDPFSNAFSIARYRNGERTPLTAENWLTFNNFVSGAGASNHVLLGCQGNTISLYINNELALSIEDPNLPVQEETRMGISVTTYESIDPGGFEMWFDNFSAWASQ